MSLASERYKILTIVGTRPEVIKMAPVVFELRRHPARFESLLVSTGQHRELLSQALDTFHLQPDIHLDLMQPGQSVSDFAGRALAAVSDVMMLEKPDAILVEGDTTTVAMAALAGFYNGVMVGHVEAGLRSFNRDEPFPEEVNREIADLVADIHFAPTERARLNILEMGLPEDRIVKTGNTIVDAVRSIPHTGNFDDAFLASLVPLAGRLLVVTLHRRESFGAPMKNVCRALKDIVGAHPDVHVVLPVHPNPDVAGIVGAELGGVNRINIIPPVSYADMLRLMSRAYLLLSDSGGIQEEAPSLNVPLLVLRNVTERPEVIEAGVAKLVGTSRRKIVAEVGRILCDETEHEKMRGSENPFGDGHAAERIVSALWERLEARHASGERRSAPSNGKATPVGRAARAVLGSCLLLACSALSAAGQSHDGYVEAGATYHRLTANLGTMQQLYLRGAAHTDSSDVWQGEIVGQREFGDKGVFYGLTNTRSLGPRVYSIASVGASGGAFFLPRYRGGLTLAYKWLPHSLVTTAGAGYIAWKDAHRDTQWSAGAIYYFGVPLVVETGVSWNRSTPGNLTSRYQFVAATAGRERVRYLFARIAGGHESYQLIAPGKPIADFRSSSVSGGVRQWVKRRWGLTVSGERYSNPSYRRSGITAGAFAQIE